MTVSFSCFRELELGPKNQAQSEFQTESQKLGLRSFTETVYTVIDCQSHKTHSRSQYHSFLKVADHVHVTKQWRLWRREWPVNGNLGCIFRKSQRRLPFPAVLAPFNQNYFSL